MKEHEQEEIYEITRKRVNFHIRFDCSTEISSFVQIFREFYVIGTDFFGVKGGVGQNPTFEKKTAPVVHGLKNRVS